MSHLTRMDRKARAMWQAAAARKRQWYQRPFGALYPRSAGVVGSAKHAHKWLLYQGRTGQPWDPYWWS